MGVLSCVHNPFTVDDKKEILKPQPPSACEWAFESAFENNADADIYISNDIDANTDADAAAYTSNEIYANTDAYADTDTDTYISDDIDALPMLMLILIFLMILILLTTIRIPTYHRLRFGVVLFVIRVASPHRGGVLRG